MKTYLNLFCFLALSLLNLPAQQSPQPSSPLPPLPPGPLIQLRAADQSQWTVKITQNSPGTKASSETSTPDDTATKAKSYFGSQLTISKSEKIIRRQTVDEKGQPWDTWCFPDVQITIRPDGQHVIVQTGPADSKVINPFFVNYSHSDFPGFQWISLKSYAGIQSFQGSPCIVFKDHAAIYLGGDATDVTAYIDLKTRYPVSLVGETQTTSYQFQPALSEPLSIPPIVQQVQDSRQKATADLQRRLHAQDAAPQE